MSREIKFRAWHQQQNRMFQVYGIGPDFITEDTLNGVDYGTNAFGYDDLNFINVMQFTGLRDKNGKEIYEGDWLQVPGYACYIVFKDGGFMSIYNHPEDGEELPIMDLGVERFQIIGNIHEQCH